MTLKETTQILAVLKVAYPNSYNNLGNEDIKAVINLWQRQFSDTTYELVMMAIDSIIASRTSAFAPTIGEIKETIVKLTSPEEITEKEAWSYIQKALGRSGYYAESEYEKLPPQVQEMTSPQQLKEWALDPNFNSGVESSNFMRGFREKSKSHKEQIMLPQNVRLMLEG